MNKLLFASCAALAFIGSEMPAMAGDLGMAGATYDWSGGYVGVNAGAALDTTKFKTNYKYTGSADIGQDSLDLIDDLDHSKTADDMSFSGGMLAGYNWQYSHFVFGAEADINYIGFNGTLNNDVTDVMSQVMVPENTTAKDRLEYTADWFGTVRGRLGYAMDNVLIYGTGGVAWGQMKIKEKLEAYNDNGESAQWESSINGYNAGWTLGGGIEYGAGRWLLGAEYLYVDLGTYDWGSKGRVFLADATLNDDFGNVKQKGTADYSFSIARATLKYRF